MGAVSIATTWLSAFATISAKALDAAISCVQGERKSSSM